MNQKLNAKKFPKDVLHDKDSFVMSNEIIPDTNKEPMVDMCKYS